MTIHGTLCSRRVLHGVSKRDKKVWRPFHALALPQGRGSALDEKNGPGMERFVVANPFDGGCRRRSPCAEGSLSSREQADYPPGQKKANRPCTGPSRHAGRAAGGPPRVFRVPQFRHRQGGRERSYSSSDPSVPASSDKSLAPRSKSRMTLWYASGRKEGRGLRHGPP